MTALSCTAPDIPGTESVGGSPCDYLDAILRGIVPRPGELRVVQEMAGDVIVLTIHLPQEDRRFVVGKHGRNIEAARCLMRAYAGRHGRMIVTKLPDEGSLSDEKREQSSSCPTD